MVQPEPFPFLMSKIKTKAKVSISLNRLFILSACTYFSLAVKISFVFWCSLPKWRISFYSKYKGRCRIECLNLGFGSDFSKYSHKLQHNFMKSIIHISIFSTYISGGLHQNAARHGEKTHRAHDGASLHSHSLRSQWSQPPRGSFAQGLIWPPFLLDWRSGLFESRISIWRWSWCWRPSTFTIRFIRCWTHVVLG